MRQLARWLADARAYLEAAAATLPRERWMERPCANYSPVGWHVGHAAATLARWLLPPEAQPAPALARFFDPFQTPKQIREQLPGAAAVLAELGRVHTAAEELIHRGRLPLAPQATRCGLPETFLVLHLVQHQLQHAEHVAVIAALLQGRLGHGAGPIAKPIAPGGAQGGPERITIEGGAVAIGSDDAALAYDNERCQHSVRLSPYWIDRDLVTVEAFSAFLAEGGYRDQRLWTPEGWAWLQRERIEAPLGWVRTSGAEGHAHPQGAVAAQLPVCGVSWYEADAFARFRGARLPTEAEREHAAGPLAFSTGGSAPTASQANVGLARNGLTPVDSFAPGPHGLRDLAGNVWEWTADIYDEGYYAKSPQDNPKGPNAPNAAPGTNPDAQTALRRVLRGGACCSMFGLPRAANRLAFPPDYADEDIGFRCAR